MADLGAWHGDPALKAAVVERMKRHREADSFAQGFYQLTDPAKALGYKGCALGCMVERVDDADEVGFAEEVEEQFGIPREVAAVIDDAFESLDFDDCAEFAVAIVEAIPVGALLYGVANAYWADVEVDVKTRPATDYSNNLISLVANAPQVKR